MPYTPDGSFSTDTKMRLMLAECPTVQAVLEVTSKAEALLLIATYAPEVSDQYDEMTEAELRLLSYPRCLIHDDTVHMETSDDGQLLGVEQRMIRAWLGFYVPELPGIETPSDEKAWVNEQFSKINDECLERTGRGESIPGSSHLCIMNPTYPGCDREPNDERGDERFDPKPNRPRWFGMLEYEVH